MLYNSNIFKNLLFNIKALVEWDFKIIILQWLYVISSIIGTYAIIKLPAELIFCLQEKVIMREYIFILGKNIFIILVCNIVCLSSHQYVYRNSGTLSMHYSRKCFNKLMCLSYEDMEKKEIHELLGNVWHVLRNNYIIRDYILAIPEIIIGSVCVVWYGYMISSMNVFIPFMVGITFIFSSLFISKIKMKYIEYHSNVNKYSRKTSYISRISMDSIIGKDVRIFNMKRWLIKEYDEALLGMDRIYNKIHNLFFERAIFDSGMLTISESFCYLFFSYQVVEQKITISQFVLYVGIVRQFSDYLKNLSNQLQTIITTNTSIDYIKRLSCFEENIASNNKVAELRNNGIKVEFRNVSYNHSGSNEKVLRNINLVIHKKEKIALIGVNGAGKTTLVKLLCGFYKPTEGMILVNDIPLDEYGEEKKRLFSVLFQDSEILPLSIDENIMGDLDKYGDYERLERSLKLSGFREKYDSFLEKGKTMLMKELNSNAVDMSGGEKQELLFARALYKNAPMLILDEPTAALDSIAECELYYKYAEASSDRTALFISHRLSSTKFCDRIVLMNKGEIVESGTHKELMKKQGMYCHLYETQSKYYVNEEIDNY